MTYRNRTTLVPGQFWIIRTAAGEGGGMEII
jgi:hypothetical protein